MESSLEFSSSLGSVSSLSGRCRTFKVLVIGDSGVGKTCLAHRLCAREFPRATEATIGVDFRERLLDLDGERIKLQLWDTAGQERFRKSLVQHYYRNVHAVLFVYDVSCPSSFAGLPSWLEECRQNAVGQEVPRFLVGNKSDLRDSRRCDVLVAQDRALAFAHAHNMAFFETSAKNPPKQQAKGRRPGVGGGEVCQQSEVEDVVAAVGAKLKRQKNPVAVASSLAYGASFKVSNQKNLQKDVVTCC
ncbi:unnamed protein product [Ophioblennius macclurei]